ncbi:hypothetical protein ACFY12_32250 [Streptomyces sp. NPDC001339]|uniref:hypothetical protein n=1 Tax=Streptomyces sp. NPDC001339 TaxID=3364563 RepID=UPI0036913C7F
MASQPLAVGLIGAPATAEANFQAVYGYYVRGEVFGSSGMLTMGDIRRTHLTAYGPDGITADWATTTGRCGGTRPPRTFRRAPRSS